MAVISYIDFEISLVSLLDPELVKNIDEMLKIQDDCLEIYDKVIERLVTEKFYVKDQSKVEMDFVGFRDTDSYQLVAEAAVIDWNKPYDPNAWNFHLQNTSQWVWACGVVFDKNTYKFTINT